MQVVSRRMGWLTGIVFGLFVVFTGLLLEQPVAFAHAFIVQSTPTDNQVLQQSPHLVEITFDEPVQTVFGGLTVTNDSGLRVDNGDAHLQADNPRILECTLKSGLPDGVYQVQWRVISADGHPVSGIIPFRVGTGTSAAGAVTQNSGYTPGVDMLLIRSLFLLGLMLVQGGLLFWRFVLAPSLRATWLKPLTAAVAWLGGGLVLVGSLLALPLQTTIDAGVPWAQAFSPPLWDRVLFYSQFGLPWVTQCVVALVQLLLLKRLYDHPRQAGARSLQSLALAPSWLGRAVWTGMRRAPPHQGCRCCWTWYTLGRQASGWAAWRRWWWRCGCCRGGCRMRGRRPGHCCSGLVWLRWGPW
ncbi:hypothetical protein GCM10025857_22090 [Alicyclobacillus contaminans]|nr:hypothetical protein GCM10025857_22090 [Alicyclobacillus contaminans]